MEYQTTQFILVKWLYIYLQKGLPSFTFVQQTACSFFHWNLVCYTLYICNKFSLFAYHVFIDTNIYFLLFLKELICGRKAFSSIYWFNGNLVGSLNTTLVNCRLESYDDAKTWVHSFETHRTYVSTLSMLFQKLVRCFYCCLTSLNKLSKLKKLGSIIIYKFHQAVVI